MQSIKIIDNMVYTKGATYLKRIKFKVRLGYVIKRNRLLSS